jgi:glutamate N-acetyltransferase / amino-acid N-acetyltransferase
LHLPRGFRFAGVRCGIKKAADRLDLSLIVGDAPLVAAGVYTQNQVFAAPVGWCRARTPSDRIQAVVTNSGNANACTGDQGDRDAAEMANRVASACGLQAADQVLVMSTGVIGHFLPMEKIRDGIAAASDALQANADAFLRAGDAIMTTDQWRKTASDAQSIHGRTIHVAGMCKGAGMIGPNMATMLGILLTDAPIQLADAASMLQRVADRSFNNISVEGHTSTNDTLLLLCSGAAGGEPLRGQSLQSFERSLTDMAIGLAKQIPADGEGATHVVEVTVRGARDHASARTIATAIANSPLVKSAFHGNDPNWGRIISAAGYSGATLALDQLQLTINGMILFQHGRPTPFDAKAAHRSMAANREIACELVVGSGEGTCTHWTSDLTAEYVRFNAEYTT